MSLRYLDIEIQNVRLTERRKFDRSVTFIGRAKLNALDAQQIDLAAERIGCTRNEFILSARNQFGAGLQQSARPHLIGQPLELRPLAMPG